MTLTLENISASYGDKQVLRGITTSCEPNQLIALVGPNGSGKSTLLKAIAGLIPHSGQLNLPKDPKSRSRALAYLGQNSTAPDRRLVGDVVALGRTPFIGRFSKLTQNDHKIIQNSLSMCEVDAFSDREFGSLSGGEKMRVHLARTLATDAPLILADEPVTALDPYFQIAIMDILKSQSKGGRLIIIALHDLKLARKYADHIWVLNAGKIVKDDVASKALSDEIMAEVFRIKPDGTRV